MMNYRTDDTIVAIATAVNNMGISIIRISGSEAVQKTDLIFRSKSGKSLASKKSHTISYGYIMDGEDTVDEVLVSIMRAPNSYTREDVVEINCHGGILVTNRILDLVVNTGIRPAEPGEFTKRAFLNGRIDLSQAEAVMDIISSRNNYALASSLSQLKGTLFDKIKKIREDIIYDTAFIEAALDDPEHISVDSRVDEMWKRVDNSVNVVDKLIKTADNGRLIKEGINTVIVGKPNVGKSSLLNLLAGDDVAIVTDVPGTTRDTIELTVNLGDIALNVIDTAGIRSSDDCVEKIGIDRAISKLDKADLVLFVMDASRQIDEDDLRIIDLLKDLRPNQKALILLNKADLNQLIGSEALSKLIDLPVFEISVKNETGIDAFQEYIKKLFFKGDINFNDEIYISNARQKDALISARSSLVQAKEGFESGISEDFITIDLMDAYEYLGQITGESIGDDLADKIFKEFCMGK